jgi:hypothetical protein
MAKQHKHKLDKREWGINIQTGERDYFCKCGKLMKTIKPKIKSIKHFMTGGRYSCNHACSTTKEKSTRNINSVTCKNCKQIIYKVRGVKI